MVNRIENDITVLSQARLAQGGGKGGGRGNMDIQERLGKVSIKMGNRVEYKQWSKNLII